jgi:hypothetical protein
MAVFEINPLADVRWSHFAEQHPNASAFHTCGWLRALRDTYRYRPVVLTTSPPDYALSNGIVFCEVKSWITGRRLVSLPFSDHCDALLESPADAREIFAYLKERIAHEDISYVEFRPRGVDTIFRDAPEISRSSQYLLHTLDLAAPVEEILTAMHKDCVQRKIRRSERESLQYSAGRSESLMKHFYRLLLRTRRRHHVPPQPLSWFRNLSQCLGDRLCFHVVWRREEALASMLTLEFRDTMTYKYGCSDERYSNLGSTPILFWNVIERAKRSGKTVMDLGRSDENNPGLITFKNRLGARSQTIQYYRISRGEMKAISIAGGSKTVMRLLAYFPDLVSEATGKILYRHLG